MKVISKIIVGFAVMFVCIGNAGTATAEMESRDLTLDGEVGLGWRVFLERPPERDRGKFEEYRDIPSGIFLENLHLQLVDKNADYIFELMAKDAGEDDQYYLFRAAKTGLYKFEFEWDQIPHVYSTMSPLADRIETRSDFARTSFSFTPTPDWDIDAQYQFIDKHGDMPKGAAEAPFSTPSNAFDFKELLQTVQYNQHDMNVSASHATQAYQLQLAYNFSLFQDDTSFVLNPESGASLRDRLALPPDNLAHSVSLSGGANLPYRTRINGTFSYGLRLQNEDLLPTNPGFSNPSLPDFDGEVNTYLLYFSTLSRPLDPLTVKAMYRFYHYGDDSEELFVPFTQGGSPFLLLAQRFPYTKQNAGMDAKWQFPWPVSLVFGYNWEQWERDNELTPGTNEHTPKISLNVTPFDWLFLGTSYSHSMRLQDENVRRDEIGHVPPPPPHAQSTDCLSCHFRGSGLPFPLFNNFNTEDRNRDQVDIFAEITPVDSLTFTITYSLARNDYDGYRFGLKEDNDWSIGGDLTWRPTKRFALRANYLHEELKTRMNADDRFFTVTIDPGPSLLTEGQVESVGAGANVILWPEKLDLDMRYMLSLAHTNFNTTSLPDLDETFNQYAAYLNYHLTRHWTVKVGYIFEEFDIANAYAHNVQQTPTSDIVTSDFFDDYTAHMLVLGLAYKF